jgi:nucleotide-binding universal stress UspA family protein
VDEVVPAGRFHRITVAIDGSAIAHEALVVGIDLAQRYGSELEIIAVAPILPVVVSAAEQPYVSVNVTQSDVGRYRAIVDRAVKDAQAAGVGSVTGLAEEGVVVDELLSLLEKHPPDLLVVGSRGLSTAKRLLLGSVSDALVHHATCPVLVVRAPSTTPAPPAG